MITVAPSGLPEGAGATGRNSHSLIMAARQPGGGRSVLLTVSGMALS
jgi:hypothetical protein